MEVQFLAAQVDSRVVLYRPSLSRHFEAQRKHGAEWLMVSFNCDLSSVLRHDDLSWTSLEKPPISLSRQRAVAVSTVAKGALRQHVITSGDFLM